MSETETDTNKYTKKCYQNPNYTWHCLPDLLKIKNIACANSDLNCHLIRWNKETTESKTKKCG